MTESAKKSAPPLGPSPWWKAPGIRLFLGDVVEVLSGLPAESVHLIFADPPYGLSNGGFTVHAGKRVSVNKGKWDASRGIEGDFQFHDRWIKACHRVLKPNGTLWVSGTYHSIYACGYALQTGGWHILNDVCWFKPNASPNLSCRMFTASHETLIWAKKSKTAKHKFHYKDMRNSKWPEDSLKKPNAQMRSVWSMSPPKREEKTHGKHPTQKPVALMDRIIRASSRKNDIVLDPFCGSATTGVAAIRVGRQFAGIDNNVEYLKKLARPRLEDEMKLLPKRNTPIGCGGGGNLLIVDPFFEKLCNGSDADAVFEHLIGTMKDTLNGWNYFVDWVKVAKKIENIEVHLNLLNYLIGKDDVEQEARHLLRQYPDAMAALPILIAFRENNIRILASYKNGGFVYEDYDFSVDDSPTDDAIDRAVDFMCKTGFFDLLQDRRIKSLVDYVWGVEVGLDTHARKNRGGDVMEKVVKVFLDSICERHDGWKCLPQATEEKLHDEWGKEFRFGKAKKRIDFVINAEDQLFFIETNFYNGRGSKLKATAKEYEAVCKTYGYQFVWITDGAGWKKTQPPLREAFDEIDYVLNLDMLQKGALEHIIG